MNLLNDSLTEYAFNAQLAGLSYELNGTIYGAKVSKSNDFYVSKVKSKRLKMYNVKTLIGLFSFTEKNLLRLCINVYL